MDENLTKDLENAAKAMNESAAAGPVPVADAASSDDDTTISPSEMPFAAMMNQTTTTTQATAQAATQVSEPAAPATSSPAVEPSEPHNTTASNEASDPITSAPTANAPWNKNIPAQPTENGPKKKSKKGLVIGCVVGGVAIAACAGFGIAYAVSEKPENVALSAASNFLTMKARKFDTTFDLKTTGDNADFSSATIHLLNQTNADGETSGTAELSVKYAGTDYKVNLGLVYLKDHTIYIQLSNLKDSVNSLVKTFSSNTEYAQYVSIFEDLINNIVGEVDGVWWKVSVPDLIDKAESDDDEKDKSKKVYNCFTDAIDKANKEGDKYAEIYKNNAFIELTKRDGKYPTKGKAYDLKFDSDKLADFENAMTDESDNLGLNTCLDDLKATDDSISTDLEKNKVTKDSVDETLKELSNMVVTIDGGIFGHNLTGFYANLNQDDYTGNISVAIDNTATVSAPSDTKNITDLYDNIEKSVKNWSATSTCKVMKSQYPTYYATYCDPTTNKILPQYQEMFGGDEQSTKSTNLFDLFSI